MENSRISDLCTMQALFHVLHSYNMILSEHGSSILISSISTACNQSMWKKAHLFLPWITTTQSTCILSSMTRPLFPCFLVNTKEAERNTEILISPPYPIREEPKQWERPSFHYFSDSCPAKTVLRVINQTLSHLYPFVETIFAALAAMASGSTCPIFSTDVNAPSSSEYRPTGIIIHPSVKTFRLHHMKQVHYLLFFAFFRTPFFLAGGRGGAIHWEQHLLSYVSENEIVSSQNDSLQIFIQNPVVLQWSIF